MAVNENKSLFTATLMYEGNTIGKIGVMIKALLEEIPFDQLV